LVSERLVSLAPPSLPAAIRIVRNGETSSLQVAACEHVSQRARARGELGRKQRGPARTN
jgi:hypothetical protein